MLQLKEHTDLRRAFPPGPQLLSHIPKHQVWATTSFYRVLFFYHQQCPNGSTPASGTSLRRVVSRVKRGFVCGYILFRSLAFFETSLVLSRSKHIGKRGGLRNARLPSLNVVESLKRTPFVFLFVGKCQRFRRFSPESAWVRSLHRY